MGTTKATNQSHRALWSQHVHRTDFPNSAYIRSPPVIPLQVHARVASSSEFRALSTLLLIHTQ